MASNHGRTRSDAAAARKTLSLPTKSIMFPVDIDVYIWELCPCSHYAQGAPMRAFQARALSEYNRWMNARLYDSCAKLSDDERRVDRGAFFASIHGTLNHLLLGDRVWLGRFRGAPFQVRSLDQELYRDFAQLRNERAATDREIVEWAAELTDEALAGGFEFSSFVNPKARRCALWVTVTHLFNHQTHHRGQLTALLSQSGVDYGVTDFIWTEGLLVEVD